MKSYKIDHGPNGRVGGRLFNLYRNGSTTPVTIQADNIRFEAGYLVFTLGNPNEVPWILKAVPAADYTRIEEALLDGEALEKWSEYMNAAIHRTDEMHYSYFINPRTKETLKEYRERTNGPR